MAPPIEPDLAEMTLVIVSWIVTIILCIIAGIIVLFALTIIF
jgi:hypothetical protein